MSKTSELSEAKRALLEKYLSGQRPQVPTRTDTIPRREQKSILPLSFGQQQLWLLAQLIGDIPVYTECVTIHLPGPLNIGVLEQSFNEILKRHEAWRTSFPVVNGQPVQKIHLQLTLSLSVVDLRHLPETEREAEAIRLMEEDAKQPFDLANGPLLRPTLVRLGDEDHRLFLTLHHIIFDGMTVYQIFLPELYTLYEAFLEGEASPLPELPIQYADFAVWQQQWLQSHEYTQQLAYWKKQLEHPPEELELPVDRVRPSIPTYRGAICQFMLSKQLTDALRAMSSREGYTLYMTLMAAFHTLLYRYTGQEDILVGTATEGRNHPSVRKLMGIFINTVVMRTNLEGNPSFLELLKQVREVTLDAHAHQTIPFERLVKELQPKREPGQNPFFQAMFMLEPPIPTLPSGWRLTHMEIDTQTSKFDLSVILEDQPEGLIGYFEYSTDLFNATTIERLVGHWQTLLESIVAHPEQRIAELPLLTEAEQHVQLVEWKNTARAYPKDKGIHQLFEEQVERTPEAVAVIFEEQQLTYHELNVRANQLAHHLRALGVGPEVLVGLCVERSLDMVVGLLGILKAGGAYVPLDPGYPKERLAFLLADTQAQVVLTQRNLIDRLPEHHPQLVCLDTDRQIISQQSETNPVDETKGKQLAYVIYTSGSTGQPKGVLIEHQAIVAHCWAIAQVYELRAEDCVLQFSTFTFDASLEQILSTLLVGARLVVCGQEIWSSTDLLHKIKVLGLTVINLPPAYWYQVLQEWVQTPQQLLGHQLRLVIVGGDRLLPEALQLWRQTPLRSVRLLNAYGPTETTITATILDIKVDREQLLEKVPIGRPLPNRTIYILDRTGHPVLVGMVGELYIGGSLLARGYLNRPELTAERFIPDPFSQQPQARLYKTGDLARYLPDGTIEFLGRVDQQVKIRGFRIELGEIEVVLGQHPAVRQAVVVAREDVLGDKRLVAYVVLHEKQTVTFSDLQEHVTQQLPGYMVPSAFVLLEALPLMTNGKVDRRALPAPDQLRPELQETFVAPRTEIEGTVAGIWSQVLRVERIGIHDNFFALGGHSLLATQVLSHIRAMLQVDLSLRRFFEAPTIAQLSTIIKYQQASGTDRQKPVEPAIRALSREAHRIRLSSISTTRNNSDSRN